MTHTITNPINLPWRHKILGALIALMIAGQTVQTTMTLARIWPLKHPAAFAFAGQKFESLAPWLKGQAYAGYYTDRNIDDTRPLLELLQAQNTLAPLILDPENINRRFVIVNCADIPRAIAKFKAMGARPVAATPYGIFLIERPEFTP